jgi:hypothetical protein
MEATTLENNDPSNLLSIRSRNAFVNLSKVFRWLLLKDRLSTRNIPRRKHMNLDSYNYELRALGVEESTEHLFLHCPFAQQF